LDEIKSGSLFLFFSIPARPHTAKTLINFLALNEMERAPHSPDLAPSDFVFGSVKRTLMGYPAEDLSELLVRIQVIVRAIPGETLVEVSSSG
jgi:hypothetical protein